MTSSLSLKRARSADVKGIAVSTHAVLKRSTCDKHTTPGSMWKTLPVTRQYSPTWQKQRRRCHGHVSTLILDACTELVTWQHPSTVRPTDSSSSFTASSRANELVHRQSPPFTFSFSSGHSRGLHRAGSVQHLSRPLTRFLDISRPLCWPINQAAQWQ